MVALLAGALSLGEPSLAAPRLLGYGLPHLSGSHENRRSMKGNGGSKGLGVWIRGRPRNRSAARSVAGRGSRRANKRTLILGSAAEACQERRRPKQPAPKA